MKRPKTNITTIYQIIFTDGLDVNNTTKCYSSRDDAILQMISAKDDFLLAFDFDYNVERTTQKELHDLDGYLVCFRCFKNNEHFATIELQELQLISRG